MKAWLDFTERKKQGEKIQIHDIKKHRRDVFALFPLVDEDSQIIVPKEVLTDIHQFIEAMRTDERELKAIGVTDINVSKAHVLDAYEKIYR